MEIENKQDKAYILYIKGLSFNQISKQTGINKDNVKLLEKSGKWDKIKKKVQEYAQLYNCEGLFFDFIFWIALYCRTDFMEVSCLAMKYNKKNSYYEDECINSKLNELRTINKDLEEIYGFVSLIYYSDKDCFGRIFSEVIDFVTQITKAK